MYKFYYFYRKTPFLVSGTAIEFYFFTWLLYLILFAILKFFWRIFWPFFLDFVPVQIVKNEKIIINLRLWCYNNTFSSFVPGIKFLKKFNFKKAKIVSDIGLCTGFRKSKFCLVFLQPVLFFEILFRLKKTGLKTDC